MKEVYTTLFRSCLGVLLAGLLMFGTAEDADAQCVVTFVDCPSDTTFYPPYPPQTCTQIVNWNPPSATNNGDAACGSSNPLTNVMQVAGPSPGTPVNVGTYTIIYHAFDANGASASCSFVVTVADTVRPTITGCTPDVTVDQELDTCGAHVRWLAPVASDACGIASFSANINPNTGLPWASGDFFPGGTTTVTYTATDLSGNTQTCSFDVTVNDTSAPVITFCPGNVVDVNDAGLCGAAIVVPDIEYDEDCPANITYTLTGATVAGPVIGVNASGFYNVGVTTVTFNVDDGSGGTAGCSFTVTITDTEAPTVDCSAAGSPINVSNDPGVCGSTQGWLVSGTDNCEYTITNDFNAQTSVNAPLAFTDFFPVGTTTVTFTSTDDAGNTATCSVSVTVTDDEDPTITCPNGGLPFATGNDPGVCQDFVAFNVTASDNCGTYTITNDVNGQTGVNNTLFFQQTYPVGGPYTVNFTVTDAAGNTATCAAVFSVLDIEDPVLSGCVDQTVFLDATCNALLTWTPPTATDNCPGVGAPVQTVGPPMGFPVAGEASFPIEYMVTDAAGNTSTCGFTVFVEDNTPPTITCPADFSGPNDPGVCGRFVAFGPPPVGDNCGVASVINDYNGTADASDTYPVGMTTVTWTVTDIYGNTATCSHDVTITDVQPPVLICEPPVGPLFTDPGSCTFNGAVLVAWTDDNCEYTTSVWLINENGDTVDMALNQGPFIPGPSGGTVPIPGGPFTIPQLALFNYPSGTNTVAIMITDAGGNTSSCSTTVTVVDNEDPLITCVPDFSVNTDPDTCGAVVSFDVTAMDNCSYVITNDFNAQEDSNQTQTFNDFLPGGVTTIVFTVTDSFGNTATCDVEVTVNDLQPPTIFCPSLNNQLTSTNQVCFAVVGWADPVGPDSLFDNCAGPVFLTQTTGLPNPGVYAVGDYTIAYLATDQAGNTATCDFSFSVLDTARPIWSGCPGDTTIAYDPALCGNTYTWTAPTPSDNCVGVYDSSTHVPGDFFPVGNTTVTYTAYDSSGNTSICRFTVTVVDNIPPTIICPNGDIVLDNDPGLCSAVFNFPDPTTSDNCGTFPPVQTSGLPSGSAFPVGVTTNEWIVTDSSGNTATCGFTVTVNDVEAPQIDCYPDMTVSTDPGVCDAFVSVPLTPGPIPSHPAPGDPYNSFDAGNSCLTFNYIDISATGTAVLSGTDPDVDDVSAVVALGAPFTIWGTPYASLAVSENGYLSTDLGESGTDFGNDCPVPAVPSNGGTGTRIYPHWDDFRMANLTDAVYYQYFPVSPYAHPSGATMGASIFQWQLTHFLSSPTADFQAILFDNGDMIFQVADDVEAGSGATVGIQSDVPGFPFGGTTYACNTGGTAGAGSVIGLSQRADICVAETYGAVFENCGIASITNDYNNTSDASDTYPLGTTVVTYTVVDVNGNTSTCQFSITVEDNEAPVITGCPADITVPNDPDMCSAVVGWTPPNVSDNCGIASFTSTHNPGDVFPVGTTTVTYTAVDVNGNTSICDFDITVNDVQDPIIVCRDTIFDNDPGKCYSSQLYDEPYFEDNCPGAFLTHLFGPMQGDTLAVGGPYTVGYMVTDGAGNTASCSFTITVIDSENPTTTCPSDIVVNNGTDTCGATVNYIPPFASDNCIVSTVTQVDGTGLTSGDVFPVGVTNQLYIVEDAAGNTTSCGFTVTVIDNQIPAWANCPADINVNNDPGDCGAIVTWTAPTPSDNCSFTSSSSHNPGDHFPVGTTTVQYVAVDASGNTGICSFTVTVIDNELPVVNCPSDITVNNEPGTCQAVVTWPYPTASDNCFFELNFYDFETGTQGWTTNQGPGSTNNFWNTYNTVAASGNNSLGTANDGSMNVPGGREHSYVQSPPFETYGGTVQISFMTYINNESGITQDVEFVEVSSNGGATWTTVHAIPEPGIHTGVTTSTWTQYSFTAPGAPAGTMMMFRFRYDTGDDFGGAPDAGPIGWYVDNVRISTNSPFPVQSAGLPSGSSFPVGTTTNVYTVTDNSGNVGTCSFDVTVIDNEDPVIAGCPSNITVNNDPGNCSAVVSWTPPTASDNCAVTSWTSSHNPGDVFPVGTTTVTYTAMDAAGNNAVCSFDVTVNDTELPVITCSGNQTISADPGTCGAPFVFEQTTTTILLQEDFESFSTCGTSANSSCALSNGWSNVNYDGSGDWLTDAFGTSSSNTGPSFDHNPGTSSGKYLYTETSGGSNRTIVVESPTLDLSGYDNAELAFWYHMYGATMGTMHVDVSTNGGASWTNDVIPGWTDDVDLWQQRVVDLTAYVGNSNFKFRIRGETGTSFTSDMAIDDFIVTGSNTFSLVTRSDNCPGSTLTQIAGLPSGSTFPVGTTTNTFMVTDASGNTATCSFDVIVTDDELPTITCPGNITESNDPGICGAAVTYTYTTSDNCPGETVMVTSGFASGSTFPVGTTTVTLQVTDASGNSTDCSFDVTVTDDEAPIVNCLPDTTISADPGECEADFTYTVPFTDNCGGATITYVGGGGMATNVDIDTTYVLYGATGSSLHRINHNDGSSFQVGPLGANGDIRTIDFDEVSGIAGGTVPGGVILPPDTVCSSAPIDVATQQSIFSSTLTRGMWFQAPVDFTLTSLMVPTSAGGTTQNIQVVELTGPPTTFSTINSPFTTLFYINGVPVGTPVPVSIPLTAGNYYGVLGASNTGASSTMHNSYGPSGPYTTMVAGQPMDLNRFIYQGSISSGPAPSPDVANSSGSIGRVEMSYEVCTIVPPPPAGEATNSEWIDKWNATETLIGSDLKSNFSYEWINGTLYAVQLEPNTSLETIYTQDFTGQDGKGATYDTGVVSLDTSGVDWMMNIGGSSLTSTNDYFVVTGGALEAQNVDGPVEWYSTPIDITTYSAVNFSLDASEFGDVEPGDYFDVEYSTDGGSTWTLITDWNGLGSGSHTLVGDQPDDDDWDLATVEATGLSGSTLVIRVTMFNDAPGERMILDNLMVTGNPYQVATIGTMNGGALNPVAVVTPPNTLPINGMAYNSSNNTLYALGTDDALYTLSWTTGAATLVGNTGVSGLTTLDYNPEDGMLYASDNSGNIYTVNAGSGSASMLSASGLALNSLTWVQMININSDATVSGTYPVGTTTESFFVVDGAGNTSSCEFDITVEDTELPTINCPADVVVNNAPGVCEALVVYPSPVTSSDNCPGYTTSLVSGLGSGSMFPVGTTTELWMVTDASGNTATCSFTVTVNDNEAPTIDCPDNVVVGLSTITETFISDTVPLTTDGEALNVQFMNLPNASGDVTVTAYVRGDLGTSSIEFYDIFGEGGFFIGTAVGASASDCDPTYGVNSFTVSQAVFNAWIADGTLDMIADASASVNDICPDQEDVVIELTYVTGAGYNGPCERFVEVPAPVIDDNCGVYSGGFTYTDSDTMEITLTGQVFVFSFAGAPTPVGDATLTVSVRGDYGLTSENADVFGEDGSFIGTVDGSTSDCGPYDVGTFTVPLASIAAWAADGQIDLIVANTTAVNSFCVDEDVAVEISYPAAGGSLIVTVTNDYTGTEDASGVYPVGTTTVTYTITDQVGNSSTCSFEVTVEDNVPPVVTSCPANIVVDNDTDTCGAVVTFADPTATDTCGIASIVQTGGIASGGFFPFGDTDIEFTITDVNGNESYCRFTVTVNDTTGPMIVCPADITVDNDPGVCQAFVTVPAPTTMDNCTVSVTNNYTGTSDASGVYPVGTTTVVWTVTDQGGNMATCSMTVTVEDTENPTITCPADITVAAAPDLCGAVVPFTQPTFGDNCPGATRALVSGGGPNSLFPVGINTVVYQVTDAAGNTATCSFTITVVDSTAPVIAACPNDIIVANDAGQCGAEVTWIPAVFVDNCDIPTVTSTANPGDFFPVGLTTVVYTATDSSGNSATCSFRILVRDEEAPVIVDCPTDIVTCDPVVTWTAPTATDNCNVASLTGSAVSGSTFPIGVTTVVYTATDDAGNTSTCGFTITVNPLPTADAGPDVDVCLGSSVAIGGNPTASGNGPFTYSWSPAAGLDNAASANPNASPSVTTTYTVTVTDDNGCMDEDEVTVTVNPTPTADAGADTAICADGSAVIGGSPSASGTVGPYLYSWAPAAGLSSTTAMNPTAAPSATTTYTLTVTDANGCEGTATVTVTVNPLPDATINAAGPFCENDGNQTLTAATAGGTWSGNGIIDPAAGTFNPASAGVGTHQITYSVTDANGCSNSATILIEVLAIPNARILAGGPYCENDDPVFLTGLPNINPHTWSGAGIDPSTGQFDPAAAGPGSHVITYIVTNANGCNDTATATVVVSPLPNAVINASGPYCELDPVATLTATVPGGIWSGPGIIQPQLGEFLPIAAGAGVHDIDYTVSTANGCTETVTTQITVFEVPAVTSIVTEASCADAADGAINITVSGGTTPYTFAWSNGANTEDLSGIAPGTYTVTVTDQNSCAQVASITVGISTTPVVAQSVITPANNAATANGEINLTVTGGVSPYTFSWSNGDVTEDVDGLLPGNYTVTIIDDAGCSYVFTYNVPARWNVGIDLEQLEKNIALYPNPTSDVINVAIEVGSIDADMTMTVYDVLGRKLYERHDAFSGAYQHQIDMRNWAAGHYMIRFDINGEQVTKKFILAR